MGHHPLERVWCSIRSGLLLCRPELHISRLNAPNKTARRSASKSEHTRDRGSPDGCRRVARSAPSAAESGSPSTEFSPQPICIVAASRWIRCLAGRCVGLASVLLSLAASREVVGFVSVKFLGALARPTVRRLADGSMASTAFSKSLESWTLAAE